MDFNLPINKDIWKKAKAINDEDAKRISYLMECRRANICPKCGGRMERSKCDSFQIYFRYENRCTLCNYID